MVRVHTYLHHCIELAETRLAGKSINQIVLNKAQYSVTPPYLGRMSCVLIIIFLLFKYSLAQLCIPPLTTTTPTTTTVQRK